VLLCGSGALLLKSYPKIEWGFVPWLAAAVIAAFLLQAMLVRSQQRFDVWLFPMAMFFAALGIIMIARLKLALFIPQLRWLIIGMLVFFLVLRFRAYWMDFLQYQYLLGILCVFLLALPLVFGTEIGGSRNWIVLGPIEVQPSEFGKILIVMFLSSYLADHRQMLSLPNHKFFCLRFASLRFIAPLLVIWGMAVLMFVVQRDLGSALLFFGIAVFMTYMATGSKSYVFLALTFFIGAAVLSYFLFGHVRVRFNIWLNPWADPNGQAYQVVQSLFAFGSGGVWGTGFAHGHPGLIPEVHTDFIFAAIAEELGLLGALGIMTGYVLFFYHSIKTALSCRATNQMLLAAGAAIVLFLQAFIIIAGVTKFLPLTGITLPFISYGGSSMVSCFILLGILVSLSQEGKKNGQS
jgi:cell division protein FtsW (lipid II flippase)